MVFHMDECTLGNGVPRRKLTLGKMFGWLTLIALTCGLIFNPQLIPLFKVLWLMILTPSALMAMAAHGGSWLQTFARGALIPALSMILGFSYVQFWGYIQWSELEQVFEELDSAAAMATTAGLYFGSIVFAGLVAVCVRWLVE